MSGRDWQRRVSEWKNTLYDGWREGSSGCVLFGALFRLKWVGGAPDVERELQTGLCPGTHRCDYVFDLSFSHVSICSSWVAHMFTVFPLSYSLTRHRNNLLKPFPGCPELKEPHLCVPTGLPRADLPLRSGRARVSLTPIRRRPSQGLLRQEHGWRQGRVPMSKSNVNLPARIWARKVMPTFSAGCFKDVKVFGCF